MSEPSETMLAKDAGRHRCVIKSSKLPINAAVDLMCVVVHFQSRDNLICQSATFYFPHHIL